MEGFRPVSRALFSKTPPWAVLLFMKPPSLIRLLLLELYPQVRIVLRTCPVPAKSMFAVFGTSTLVSPSEVICGMQLEKEGAGSLTTAGAGLLAAALSARVCQSCIKSALKLSSLLLLGPLSPPITP